MPPLWSLAILTKRQGLCEASLSLRNLEVVRRHITCALYGHCTLRIISVIPLAGFSKHAVELIQGPK